ncbi:MAG: peptidylprolyl isomerase [Candidatus Eisenbacteria bacterium]
MTRNPLRRAASSCPAPPALALAALAALLAGCSSDPDVLARVNGEAITLAQFNEVARGNLQQYTGPPDSVKARLLKDLVDRELMVQGALREGLDETPEFQAFRQQLERQTLRETLFQRLLGGPFPVSDGEVRELYQRRGTATHVRLIFTFYETPARQALKDLKGGDDFATVADRYNPPGTVPPGGDIGFIQPGSLLPPLDDLVRTGPLARVLGPIEGGGEGWFVLRLEERRPQAQPPFEEVRAQLGEMLRQRKQRVSVLRVVDNLRIDHQVLVLPGAPQTVVGRLRPTPGLETPPPPGPDERKQVLARYRGGAYTLGEAYDDLMSATGNRPNLAMLPTVERWIESQTIERAALAEALKRHIHEEPEVERRMRDRLNNFLLDGYYQRQVMARIQIGPGDFQAAYERHKASFARLQAARVVSVTMRDSAGAAALAEQAGHVPSLREAAATAAAGGRVREEKLTFPADSPLWTQFESKLMSMSAGNIAGPYPVAGGWLIFQLLAKRQDAPPFESLPAGARGQLQGVAAEIKREARLAALTDSLRRVFPPIELHVDRLRRIPWPPAPAAPPGT